MLDDYRPDIVSGATARRRTNIYFLATAVAAWMIPVMSALDQSVVALDTRLRVLDVRAGVVLWEGTAEAGNDERPSGIPGETDEHYLHMRLDQIGSDLAARIHDQLCLRLPGP